MPFAGLTTILEEYAYRINSTFSGVNFFSGPNGSGVGALGTFRLVHLLRALPGAGQKVIFSRAIDLTGGYHVHGSAIIASSIGLTHRESGGAGFVTSPEYVFVAGEVGMLFVHHFTLGAAAGATLRNYTQGAEVGVGTVLTGTRTAAPAGAGFWVGDYQGAPGVLPGGSWCGVISACVSATEMTAAQVANDASAIMAHAQRLALPVLPGESQRYATRDLVYNANWPDRDGNDCTLAANGVNTIVRI